MVQPLRRHYTLQRFGALSEVSKPYSGAQKHRASQHSRFRPLPLQVKTNRRKKGLSCGVRVDTLGASAYGGPRAARMAALPGSTSTYLVASGVYGKAIEIKAR